MKLPVVSGSERSTRCTARLFWLDLAALGHDFKQENTLFMNYPAPLNDRKAQDETHELRPKFGADGLIAAIAQDDETGEVLMLAWMNAEALSTTLNTGKATFWSRSRGELWEKGATSGNTQTVVSAHIDCDQDAILLRVRQSGGACHTGRTSCFYRTISGNQLSKVPELG